LKILLVDNYDSFTYNLAHYLEQFPIALSIVRPPEIPWKNLNKFDGIVLSPGPGLPSDSDYHNQIISESKLSIPILGICLGHQAIGAFFGVKLKKLPKVLHGIQNTCNILVDDPLFMDVPKSFTIGHYHSWILDDQTFSSYLEILANDEEDSIMVFKHKKASLYGIQFHPESILTPHGFLLLKNWITLIRDQKNPRPLPK
jgi:anthranilate synthase/aminodeoxychorismate synthase-like glutamine amidotransferase